MFVFCPERLASAFNVVLEETLRLFYKTALHESAHIERKVLSFFFLFSSPCEHADFVAA